MVLCPVLMALVNAVSAVGINLFLNKLFKGDRVMELQITLGGDGYRLKVLGAHYRTNTTARGGSSPDHD